MTGRVRTVRVPRSRGGSLPGRATPIQGSSARISIRLGLAFVVRMLSQDTAFSRTRKMRLAALAASLYVESIQKK
jgi:hypothetical protein